MTRLAPPSLPGAALRDGRGAPECAATSPEPLWWCVYALGHALLTLAAASIEAFTRKWE